MTGPTIRYTVFIPFSERHGLADETFASYAEACAHADRLAAQGTGAWVKEITARTVYRNATLEERRRAESQARAE